MREFRSVLSSAFLIVGLVASPVSAAEVSTGFEFNDVSENFSIGTTPESVLFSQGKAQSLGELRLHHGGFSSWMVDVGHTGTILFETPVTRVTLFLRDESPATASTLRVLGFDGAVLATYTANAADWTAIDVTEPAGIGSITLENAGSGGHAVIDDFVATTGNGALPPALEDPIPAPIEQGGRPVRLVSVADGLTAPNTGTFAFGRIGKFYVADQPGQVWEIDLRSKNRRLFLDVSEHLVPLGIFGEGTFDERGLLGLAFHPFYLFNGLLYTYTSEPVDGPADFSTMPAGVEADHQSVITEWRNPAPWAPDSVADPSSRRRLLRIDQPQFNHNGGAIAFGHDKLLYIALGDGGGADDQDGQPFLGGAPVVGHGPAGNGQDPSNPLGAILRIDPLGADAPNAQYGIPGSNPFVGVPNYVQEIWAYGFRNPFRISFDLFTGDLYAGDVGQNDIEEIDRVERGGNHGWRHKEGTFFFEPNGFDGGFVTDVDPGDLPADLVDPIAQYDHDEGLSVIGGFVYRGFRNPALRGRYVFGDFARTFSNDGRLFFLKRGTHEPVELRFSDRDALGLSLLGIGQDHFGELYVLGNSTATPFGETGVVMRIAPGKRPHRKGFETQGEPSGQAAPGAVEVSRSN